MENRAQTQKILFYCELAIIFSVFIYLSVPALATLQSGRYQSHHIVNVIKLLGLALFLTGFTIRILARRTLGKYFSTKLRVLEDHEIVVNGVYRFIRHPAYLGLLCIFLAIPLLFYSLYGFILILLAIPDVLYRIRREESMLIERFGSIYEEYMKTTKKLLPYIY
jgi:protein-S-isoprenylcysteine O-methyltransferase Ste14